MDEIDNAAHLIPPLGAGAILAMLDGAELAEAIATGPGELDVAVRAFEERHDDGDLRFLFVLALQAAPHQDIELLVRPAELHVGFERQAAGGAFTDVELQNARLLPQSTHLIGHHVGLGPAAEGDPNASPEAVKVLRELASETGGSYASANNPSELDRLFQLVRHHDGGAARPPERAAHVGAVLNRSSVRVS